VSVAPWTQYRDPGATPPPSRVTGLSFVRIKGRFGAFGTIRPDPGQTVVDNILFRDIDVRLAQPTLAVSGVRRLRFERVRVNGALQPTPTGSS
jgi:alpha-L-rhamnosidase